MSINQLLTFPESASMALPMRAKALLFHDPLSVTLLEEVERIAHSEATVLVVGETGTGKELIARHIHHCSGRLGPFVAVNCGAFSENMIDAELFGHERGAFTGASHARAGWFEAADGGTLFLDEIGDLPLALQVKLLRVLQERQVVRLGSRRATPIDVRLVAATNVQLQRAVEAQHFRADLYYRLSVASVSLPPLRERPGDILPLARHFMNVYAGKLRLEDTRLTEEAQSALLAYGWPGNIRELENVIHYALIVCRDGQVCATDFRFSPLARTDAMRAAVTPLGEDVARVHGDGAALHVDSARPPAEDCIAALEQAIDEAMETHQPHLFQTFEALLVRRAFARCHDNQVRSARLLGITRNTLRTLLKRHGLLSDGAGLDLLIDAQALPDPSAAMASAPAYSFER